MINYCHKPPSARLVIEGAADLEMKRNAEGELTDHCITAKGRELVVTVTGDATEADARTAIREMLVRGLRELDDAIGVDRLSAKAAE